MAFCNWWVFLFFIYFYFFCLINSSLLIVGMLLSEVCAMASELYPDIYEDIFPLANIK